MWVQVVETLHRGGFLQASQLKASKGFVLFQAYVLITCAAVINTSIYFFTILTSILFILI
jgi:hypothetical protein